MKTRKNLWLWLLFWLGFLCVIPGFYFMAIASVPGGDRLYAALGNFLFAFFPLAVAQAIRGGLFRARVDFTSSLLWVARTLFLLTLLKLLPLGAAQEWLENIVAFGGIGLALYAWVKAYKKAKK